MKAPVRLALQVALLAALYLGSASINLMLGGAAGFVTVVWPPAGLALAALLLFGYRVWPAIALGAFIANRLSGAPLLTALGIAGGNALEAWLGAYALQRMARFQPSLERVPDVVALVVLAAGASTAVGATVGVSSLHLGGVLSFAELGETWRAWWLGDAVGDLVVAPLLLTWWKRPSATGRGRAALLEVAAVGAVLAVVSLLVFGGAGPFDAYLFFPALIWAAIRFGQRGAATTTFLISAIAIAATAYRRGPFVKNTLAESLFALQTFMAVAAATFLVLGAVVSERRRLMERQRNSERRKAAILDASLDSFITIDHRGDIVEFNRAAEKAFGHQREQVIGKELAALVIPPHLRERHRRGLERYLATGKGPALGKRVEFPALRADGREFTAEIAIEAIRPDAGPPLFTASLRDISAQRRQEIRQQFMLEATALLASSLDEDVVLGDVARLAVPRMSDWCWIDCVAPGGRIERLSLAHADAAQAPLARELEELHPHPPAAPEVIRTGEPELVEEVADTLLARLAGDAGHLALLRKLELRSYLAVPIRTPERVLGAMTFATTGTRRLDAADLAAARQLANGAAMALERARLFHSAQHERQMAEEAVRARDAFLSVASHELRNPIGVLHLNMELFQRNGPQWDRGRVANAVAQMSRQVQRLTRLVDRLLDVSRISTGKVQLEYERTDLSAIAQEVAARFDEEIRRSGSTVTVRAPSPVVGMWDAMRLDQIVTNLLSNALKYGSGKPIGIRVDGEGDTARLVVEDQGIGIGPGDQARIFERFERVTEGHGRIAGLGLGLWIVRQLASALGGSVTVESELGKGARFTVALPRTLQPARAMASVPAAALPERREARWDGGEILVVEDDPDALDTIRDVLRGHGYSVAGAGNGREALDYLQHARPPRVILLDLTMPVMDGIAFLHELRSTSASIPVILVSADGHLARKAHELHVAACVSKPINVHRLVSTVEPYCRASSA